MARKTTFFADSHGKVFDMPTGKRLALVTSGVPLFFGAFSDLTLPAMHKRFIRQAAAAVNVFSGHPLLPAQF